ncbi:Manganese transport system membrane protein MntB [Posidoniimonas polymericola]|uniref:Manganese transport system membrane protein MntB n=1 Tax=Posidoniimonas polymericola TaxID=2528002 RepID=A0A5C5XUS7_9BACT|nr:iron chelate uptake ABC transporter family permease subunit [Posidoniimonas polymericola]TWT66321.1 Manganese transport system membrane protein MntB [Posidoniimonas polymericola]
MLASFVAKITLGAALLGGVAGVVGGLAVLRKRSLMGDVLSHAALPGICIAYLVFNSRSLPLLSLGALSTGLLAAAAIALVTRWTRTREDAAMALTLSTFFGAGVVLLTVVQQQARGNQAGLASYLFGEIAALRSQDVVLIGVVAAVLLVVVTLLHKELKTLCFDDEFARSQGWPTLAMDIGMMAAVAVVTVVGLPVCGVVLMAAMLIMPCVAARYWSNRLGVVLSASGVIGAASAACGVLAAAPGGLAGTPLGRFTQGMPPGPLIVVAGGLVFAASALLAPEQGLLGRARRTLGMRVHMAHDHLLRLMFEAGEPALPAREPIALAGVLGRMSATPVTKYLARLRAIWQGQIERTGPAEYALTSKGLAAAARVTRAHRLWEQFLVEHADIAADHVHRSADDIEHVLPAHLVDELERELHYAGRLPLAASGVAVPQSPHVIPPPR